MRWQRGGGGVIVAVVAAAGCQSSSQLPADTQADTQVDAVQPMFQPFWKSGTRMRARLWTSAEGGDPIFGGWRDTLLDTNCESALAADGVERCLPRHAEIMVDKFADASCTQPLAWAPASRCGGDKFAVDRDTSDPPKPLRAFRVLAVHTGTVFIPGTAGCAPLASPGPGTWYTLGSEEPPASFAATENREVQVGDFVHRVQAFADGSSVDQRVLRISGHTCVPTGGISAGTTGCRPSAASLVTPVYSDSTCTQRAFVWSNPYVRFDQPLPPIDELVVDEATALCGPGARAFSVFDHPNLVARNHPGQSHLYYVKEQGMCTSQELGIGGALFTATPSSRYPTGTIAPSAVTGRLGYLMWTGPDGVSVPIASWDHQLHRECLALIANDGTFRCMPQQPQRVVAKACDTSARLESFGYCDGVLPVKLGDDIRDNPSGPSCDEPWFGGGWSVHVSEDPPYVVNHTTEAGCEPFSDRAAYAGGLTTIAPGAFAALQEMIE